MSGFCNGKNVACAHATNYGDCQIAACCKHHEPKNELGNSQLIRCPNGHIVGVCGVNGTVEIKHKGRTIVVSSSNANVQITCEQCGKMVTVYLDCGKTDVEECI